MDKLYVYYVMVEFARPHESYITGVRSRVNLVIAPDEQSAVKIMQDKVNLYSGTVSLPDFKESSLSAEDIGHGMEVTAFLEQGSDEIDGEKIVSYYSSKVNCELQLWDNNGEVKMLNTFNHDAYTADAPRVPKNVFVQLDAKQEDSFESGVALLANQTDTQEEEALIRMLGGSVLLSESTSNVKSADYDISSVRQVKVTADGAILVREKAENSNIFTEWGLTPVFTEEAPHDGHQYVRFNSHWVPITVEGTDIYEDDIDAFLNGTAHIIENSGILVARTVNSTDTKRTVNQVLINNDGEIYTRKVEQRLNNNIWAPDMNEVEWIKTFHEIDARFDANESSIRTNADNISINQKSIKEIQSLHASDMTSVNSAIQTEVRERQSAISELSKSYKSADSSTLNSSKAYTNNEISKLSENLSGTISSLLARVAELENKVAQIENH